MCFQDKTKFSRSLLYTSIVASTFVYNSIVWAQDIKEDNKLLLEEVIVTAEKRSSSIQDTAIAVTALSGQDLLDQGVVSVQDLVGTVPGLSSKSGGPGQNEFIIRGLSSTAGVAPTVSFYMDEIPINPPAASSSGKSSIDPSLYDLSRVEVLRGPQGTLYGASSLGGTIKLVTNKPDLSDFDWSARVSGSNIEGGSESGSLSGMINIPVIEDRLALRLVGTNEHRGGWINRVVDSEMPVADPGITGSYYDAPRADLSNIEPDKVYEDVNEVYVQTYRASLLYSSDDARLKINPSFFYQRIEADAPDTVDEMGYGGDSHVQPFDISEESIDEVLISSLDIEYSFDNFDFKSITSYSERELEVTQDSSETFQKGFGDDFSLNSYYADDGGLGPVYTTETQPTRQIVQEFRLTSSTSGPLRWIAGIYYSDFSSSYQASTFASDAESMLGTTNLYLADLPADTKEKAVYGNISYDFTSELTGTFGLRYYEFEVESSGESSGFLGSGVEPTVKDESRGSSPYFNLSYSYTEDNMVYATVSKGLRQGAAQSVVPSSVCSADLSALGKASSPSSFGPDTAWNYEIGSKNRIGDSVILNAAAYQMKWDDVQQYVLLPACGFEYMDNAGSVTVDGFELETRAMLSESLSLTASLGYTDASYDDADPSTGTLAGDRLDNVPEWTASGAITYETFIAGFELYSRLGVSYVDSTVTTSYEEKKIPSLTMSDARVSLEKDNWSVAFFVNNLTDESVVTNYPASLTFGVPGATRVNVLQPRTFGIELSMRR